MCGATLFGARGMRTRRTRGRTGAGGRRRDSWPLPRGSVSTPSLQIGPERLEVLVAERHIVIRGVKRHGPLEIRERGLAIAENQTEIREVAECVLGRFLSDERF